MMFTLLLNIILLPVHIMVWVFGKNWWPIVPNKAIKQRLDYYEKLYKPEIKKFIYK